ncbi:MAG TPA: DUF4082 domain-containing protein [Chitinophagaceae bacterium]|nr:DUF4082 domain-containing protein [Chitinophagaceae bacterium]
MAEKRPLVLYNGIREELRTGDFLSTKKPLVLYGGTVEELRAGDSLDTKKPLVHYNGVIEQLRSGDTVAGIVSTTPMIATVNPGGAVRNNFTGRVGFQFLLFSGQSLTVTHLSFWKIAGNTGNITVELIDNSIGVGSPVASAIVDLSTGSAGGYVDAALAAPVTIPGNKYYSIMANVINGGIQWYDVFGTTFTLTEPGRYSGQGGCYEFSGTITPNGSGNETYGPTNLKYQ